MQKLLLFTLFSFLCCALYAQSTVPAHPKYKNAEDSIHQANLKKQRAQHIAYAEVELSKEIKAAQFIFEGTIIEAKQTGHGIANQIVKIHKIFKGNLTCGTVKIIADGGNIKMDSAPEVLGEGYGRFEKGTSALFLCSGYTYANSNILLTTNKPDNSVIVQTNNMIQYDDLGDGLRFEAYASLLGFGNYAQLYNRLLKEPGIKMEKCDSMDFKKRDDSLSKLYHYRIEHGYYNNKIPSVKDTLKIITNRLK